MELTRDGDVFCGDRCQHATMAALQSYFCVPEHRKLKTATY
jgi:hypothetical protein